MENIKIVIDGPLMDGHRVTFKAPCSCAIVDGFVVHYVKDNTQASRFFTMKDTHGNDLAGLGNLFDDGAYVHAILDTTNGFAYIQNAATNSYIEGEFKKVRRMYDVAYDVAMEVGNQGSKKIYRIRKKFTKTFGIYERTPVAHGISCSDIWVDMSQSFLSATSSDMYSPTDKIPLINPNMMFSYDATNIYVSQALTDQPITIDVVLYYVEV